MNNYQTQSFEKQQRHQYLFGT